MQCDDKLYHCQLQNIHLRLLKLQGPLNLGLRAKVIW